MCRMAVIFDTVAPFEGKAEELAFFLAFLERSQGGQGNGIGTFVDGKPQILKAVKFTVSDCATRIMEQPAPATGWYWHTRLASMGGVKDELCHPFTQGKYLFMHNGCWNSVYRVGKWLLHSRQIDFKTLKECSDSSLMSWLIERFGYDALNRFYMNGKIIVGTKDKTYLWTSWGEFEGLRFGKSWIYASEFPLGMERKADEHVAFGGTDSIVVELRTDGYTKVGESGIIRTIPPPSLTDPPEYNEKAWNMQNWAALREMMGGD